MSLGFPKYFISDKKKMKNVQRSHFNDPKSHSETPLNVVETERGKNKSNASNKVRMLRHTACRDKQIAFMFSSKTFNI